MSYVSLWHMLVILLYAFFWVIPWRLNFICRRFGKLPVPSSYAGRCVQNAYEDGTDSVPKRRHIKFRRQGITQKKAYNIGNINLVGMNINIILRNMEAVVFVNKEVLLQVFTEETKYIFMNIEQNSRQFHNKETRNEYLENVSVLRHLAMTSKIRITCIKT